MGDHKLHNFNHDDYDVQGQVESLEIFERVFASDVRRLSGRMVVVSYLPPHSPTFKKTTFCNCYMRSLNKKEVDKKAHHTSESPTYCNTSDIVLVNEVIARPTEISTFEPNEGHIFSVDEVTVSVDEETGKSVFFYWEN